MESCIYRGHVLHARGEPSHRFQYSTSWVYLDLNEVEELARSSWLFSTRRFSLASFRRADHFGDPNASMSDAVRELVERVSGDRPAGPIRVLTQLRQLGFYFSPLNVFYCFSAAGSPHAMVAEVSNTPWNERHCYVLWDGNRVGGTDDQYAHPKSFHVSPFMGMDTEYRWKIGVPDDSLAISISCAREGKPIFFAGMQLEKVPLSNVQLAINLLRRPVAAASILGAIYYQAFRLWMKKCQYFPHPRTPLSQELGKQVAAIATQQTPVESR